MFEATNLYDMNELCDLVNKCYGRRPSTDWWSFWYELNDDTKRIVYNSLKEYENEEC